MIEIDHPDVTSHANGALAASVHGYAVARNKKIHLRTLTLEDVVAVVLNLSGSVTFTVGTQGNGAINGTITAAIDPFAGHIRFLVPTGFPLFDRTGVPIGVAQTEVSIEGNWHQ